VPKRSNTFQTVVFLIKNNIAGPAIVTESAELTDLATGEKREVDVVIEANVAGHAILISIECRDHKRPQTVEWVDAMQGKHRDLPTDRLVLVSRSGFTPQALAKAHAGSIETVVPDELTEESAAQIGARISCVQLGSLKELQIIKVCTVVADVSEPVTVPAVARNMPVYTDSGRPVALIGDLVSGIIAAHRTDHITVSPVQETPQMEIRAENPRLVIDSEPCTLYLKVPNPEPHLSRLQVITITAQIPRMCPDVSLQHGKLQDTVYSWAEATLDGKPTVIVMTEADDGTPTVGLRQRYRA
jgi:hypothetical protein